MDKQDIVKQICTTLGIPYSSSFISKDVPSGGGSTVTREFYAAVYEQLSGGSAHKLLKTDIAKAICKLQGRPFLNAYTSELSKSKGGSTITKAFLEDLLSSL